MLSNRIRLLAGIAAITSAVVIVLALLLAPRNSTSPQKGGSAPLVAPVTPVTLSSQDLPDRLRKLVNIKSLEIFDSSELTVNVAIQSGNKDPVGNLDDVLQKALVEHELQLNYWISAPVRAYTITITKEGQDAPIFLGSRYLSPEESSQNHRPPEIKKLDNEAVSGAIHDGLSSSGLKLVTVTTTQQSFSGSTQQVAKVVLIADSIDALNSVLQDVVMGLPSLINEINTRSDGQIAIFSLQIVDANDRQFYGQVWDQDLASGFIQFADGVRRYSSNGEVSGPAPTSYPGDPRLSTPVSIEFLTALPATATAVVSK